MAALPELQELNAIATAEGAVALAMREQNTTLFDTRCVVLGYGRCGSALCRRLAALGAHVTAAARRRAQFPATEEVLADIFAGADYPVLIGAPFGHQPLNLPLPFGVRARLNEEKLELLEAPVLA